MAPRKADSKAYRQRIRPFLKEWEERGFSKEWQQFRNWSVEQVLWDQELSPAEIEDATQIDGSDDKGIDAWYFDEDADPPRLILIQAKDQEIGTRDFPTLLSGFRDVVSGLASGNAALQEKAAAFRLQPPKFFNLELYLTTSTIAQEGYRPKEDGSPVRTESEFLKVLDNSFAKVSYYVRDIKYLYDKLQVYNNARIGYTFHVDKDAFFAFEAANHKTVCAAIAGEELAELFLNHRENLFRENPRYHLRSVTNERIKGALRESQPDFFLYNNGLTCVARTINLPDGSEGDKVRIEVEDFQIVNGCQTVASIWSVFKDKTANISKVRVLAKIVENSTAGSDADGMSMLIAERSNTQNALKAFDWKANDKRQQRWHALLQRMDPPWFYEIKRGTWAALPASDKAHYRSGKTTQKVSMKELGQAGYAFLGYPGSAADKPRNIFKSDRGDPEDNRDNLYDTIFHEGLSGSQLLLPHLVFLEADEIAKRKPTLKLSDAKDDVFPSKSLRFPAVAIVGHMLSALAEQKQGYLSPAHSDELLRNRTWLPEFAKTAFDVLEPKLAEVSRAPGSGGPRRIVRGDNWMGDAPANALNQIRAQLRTEQRLGASGEGTLSGSLPF